MYMYYYVLGLCIIYVLLMYYLCIIMLLGF